MKVPAVLLTLALATSVAAQGTPELPKCAQSCADQYLKGGIGNCGTDPKCICANSLFIDSIACCLVGVCDAPAQTSAVVFASSLCSAFGVTTLPTVVSCSTVKPTGAQTSVKTTATASTKASASAGASASDSETPESTPTPTGSASDASGSSAPQTSSESTNFGPRPTAAPVLGAIGGIVAAMALL
ncbi:hypothetical protein QBC38DRAFT_477843 [Podospora fimiseda]|uniref:CFEM domain-containing protein n=1 Tax=Podospora fimiseda TaxID=252190 RepID=A0AAN7BQ34_9PEZI|nr:hypothetical protein QBC38DRAFT_477843 [Podospora fimiseda]